MVEVTQADREAAIKIFAMIFGSGHSATYALARSYRHFLFDELAATASQRWKKRRQSWNVRMDTANGPKQPPQSAQ